AAIISPVGEVKGADRGWTIVGLAGLEGHGQRAVVMALAGSRPWRGDVTLRGRRHTARGPAAALRAGVALVPSDRQVDGLIMSWPVTRNVSLSSLRGFRRRGLLDAAAERRAAGEIGAELGLPHDRFGEPVAGLSGGNQQRALLARVLMTKPSLLLLYDGTRGVDVATRAEILDVLSTITANGTSILFYSSDIAEYAEFADRVLVMSGGSIVGEVTGPEITEESVLALAVTAGGDRGPAAGSAS
ncbi:ATP-binding cassette domain-containing protein, partial [Actinomadura roseirufa]|uniref:ATP-binding cassette domain-containing protein n=1 Tax=Actinomadura roseirufa TaxID=2094049 RepID=UPI0010410387